MIEATFGTSKRFYRANDIRAKLDNIFVKYNHFKQAMLFKVGSCSVFKLLPNGPSAISDTIEDKGYISQSSGILPISVFLNVVSFIPFNLSFVAFQAPPTHLH